MTDKKVSNIENGSITNLIKVNMGHSNNSLLLNNHLDKQTKCIHTHENIQKQHIRVINADDNRNLLQF